MTLPRLLPCPFCGGTEAALVDRGGQGVDWAVQCGGKQGCGAAMGMSWIGGKREAVARWNTRQHVVTEPLRDGRPGRLSPHQERIPER